ncbi:MAG TPA: hypothetical protein VJT54_05885 [Verrucomicrobiae bacterium]|nr:hypothetical protein [Verrucomicrobiae bacterium]
MNVSTAKIDEALLDVRKAYRLLHDYQRMALDAAKYIGTQLELTYVGGYPCFSKCAPRDGKGSLDNWAWDWLNLMFYEFHFHREITKDQWINLSIWLFSDTGYFISDDRARNQTDVNTFLPVDKAGTKVGFLLYRDWKQEYYRLRDNEEYLRRFLEHEGELPELLKDGGVLGTCCDFSQLADEASTEAVIDGLVRLAQDGKLPLNRVKKHS